MDRWFSWGIVVALTAGALAVGCHRRRYDPYHDARRLERYERRLIEVGARDSGCSPVQVEPVRIAERVWVTNTCTGPREYFLQCRQRGRRWANCSWRRVQTVSQAAAPILSCPEQSIAQQVGSDPMTRSASGCGRSVQVTLQCNAVGCGWVSNGPAQGAANAPPGYGGGGGATVVIVPAQ